MGKRILAFILSLCARNNVPSAGLLLAMGLLSAIGSYHETDRPGLAAACYIAASITAVGLLHYRLRAHFGTQRDAHAQAGTWGRFQRLCLSVRRLAALIGIVAGTGVVVGVSYTGYIEYTGNFDVIVPGQAYRSAQPSNPLLRRYIHQYDIKTGD